VVKTLLYGQDLKPYKLHGIIIDDVSMSEKTFACRECGKSYVASPPDSDHIFASITKGARKNEVEWKYSCPDGHTNLLYWGE